MRVLIFWITLFMICGLMGETIILGGEVNGVWTEAGSPYMIHNNISIANGECLQIEPAVEIIFIYNYSLTVYGSLQSEGTITDSIYWTVSDTTGFSDISTPAGGWGGILFDHCDASIDNVLSYNRLEYGKAVGEEMQSNCGGAVRADSCLSVVITNCRLSDNLAGNGGAIASLNGSVIVIANNEIIANKAYDLDRNTGDGGAIFCHYDTGSTIENNIIAGNSSESDGGGICYKLCENFQLNNNLIERNSSPRGGGGIYSDRCEGGVICGNEINQNSSSSSSGGGISLRGGEGITIADNLLTGNSSIHGGGIYCSDSDYAIISDNIIEGNIAQTGAGISKGISEIGSEGCLISGNSIRYNRARVLGGGLYWSNCTAVMDSVDLNSIYMNQAILGDDVYSKYGSGTVYLDTMTVAMATGAYVYPVNDLEFDILHGLLEQENADLYVSPDGDDSSSGLSWASALKTLDMAARKIIPGEEELTIHLAAGVYGNNSSDEVFPIVGLSKVNICGAGAEATVLDAEGSSMIFYYIEVDSCCIRDLTIRNTLIDAAVLNQFYVAAVYLDNSDLRIENAVLRDNVNHVYGGSLNVYNESRCELENVKIHDNSSYSGSAIYANDSEVIVNNCQITGNTSFLREWGSDGCLESKSYSEILITNTTIADNNCVEGYVLHCDTHSGLKLINCICYNNSEVELWTNQSEDFDDPLLVAYSDIRGGEASIWNTHDVEINWLEGNIEANPIFVDAEAGDYRLVSWSPCVDSGIDWFEWLDEVLVDIGEAEYSGLAPDMGCYEHDANAEEPDEIIPVLNYLVNYPNPFNPETTIVFYVQQPGNVKLAVYNVKGQIVKVLADEIMSAGENGLIWDGRNDRGNPVSSGVYFVRLQSKTDRLIKKIILMK